MQLSLILQYYYYCVFVATVLEGIAHIIYRVGVFGVNKLQQLTKLLWFGLITKICMKKVGGVKETY